MKTALAPLRLENVSCSNVESIESYIARLAHVHCVSPNKVLLWVRGIRAPIETTVDEEGSPRSNRSSATLSYADACGYSATTQSLVSSLSTLTGQPDLSRGSLLILQDAFSKNVGGCFERARRWCPKCYYESDGKFAEPLAWGFTYIKTCEVHGCDFVSKCRDCGSPQSYFRSLTDRQFCKMCKKPLGRNDVNPSNLSVWDRWSDEVSLDLLAHTANIESPMIDANFLERFFDTSRLMMSPKDLHRRVNGRFFKSTKRRLTKSGGTARPRMDSVFRLSAQKSVKPLDLMLRPEECASPLLIDESIDLVASIPRLNHDPEVYEKLLTKMDWLLNNDVHLPLPSLQSLCDELGITPAGLYQRFNSQRKIYSSARAGRSKAIYDANFEIAIKFARDYEQTDRAAHNDRGIVSLERKIRAATNIPKHICRAAAVIALNRENPDSKDCPVSI